jgi:hypothetical protein
MRLLIPMDFRPLATGLKQPISLVMERRIAMKAGIFFTGTGPILILTSYESLDDPKLVEKLAVKESANTSPTKYRRRRSKAITAIITPLFSAT